MAQDNVTVDPQHPNCSWSRTLINQSVLQNLLHRCSFISGTFSSQLEYFKKVYCWCHVLSRCCLLPWWIFRVFRILALSRSPHSGTPCFSSTILKGQRGKYQSGSQAYSLWCEGCSLGEALPAAMEWSHISTWLPAAARGIPLPFQRLQCK